MWTYDLRREDRIVLVPARHALAGRETLTVEEILDETFIGLHPLVEPKWAGFWSLDDYRGGPPAKLTRDQAAKPQEVLAALAVRDAITTVPASVARIVMSFPSGVLAVPLLGARPVQIVLAGRIDRRSALVEALLAFAETGVRLATVTSEH